MSLASLNGLPINELRQELTKCCGSGKWVEKMCSVFPVPDAVTLFNEAEKKWFECTEDDWLHAFRHHPKIGDAKSLKGRFPETGGFSEKEQAAVKAAPGETLEALAHANTVYEKKFGFIFIVFASGKSAEEMLSILQARLNNTREDEIKTAMQEQQKITALRLKKILDA